MVPAPILTWYDVKLGVIVAGVRVPVDTQMLAANTEEIHNRCARVAEGMGGKVGDVMMTAGNPVGSAPAPVAGYLPPPCTYKPEPRPDPIVLNPDDGWVEFKDIAPGIGAFLGGPKNDKATA